MTRPSPRAQLAQSIEEARQGLAYRNYLRAREHVLEMLEHTPPAGGEPSAYWREELTGFDYLLDAPPLVVASLRQHCYHLTGLRSYEYRRHHRHKSQPFAAKLASLRAIDRSGLFMAESPLLGGFGHELDGDLLNVDTLKFYEALIALDRARLLNSLGASAGEGNVVLEIGAGWGGFAYQVKRLYPRLCHVIVDLPPSLLIAATYLMTAFPQAPVAFADPSSTAPIVDLPAGGFLFVPHFAWERLQPPRVDLAVNMCSFQEMTTVQVAAYVQGLRDLGARAVYSLNRDRSSHNTELTTVSSILAQTWEVEEIRLLEADYTTLGKVKPWEDGRGVDTREVTAYRHLLGRVRRG